MSQPPSHSTLPPYSSPGSSGTRSSFGSFEVINEHQYHSEHGGGYGSNGGHLLVPESRELIHHYSNLPSSVKLPPSYKHSQEYQYVNVGLCVCVCVCVCVYVCVLLVCIVVDVGNMYKEIVLCCNIVVVHTIL